MENAIHSVRTKLRGLADPAFREQLARVVPGAKALGVRVPALRALADGLVRGAGGLSLEGAAELLDDACESGVREEMLVGLFAVARFRRQVEGLAWTRIERWLEALDNWETCDQLAANIAGAVVHKHPGLVRSLLEMTGSPNAWRRRFAVATAAKLNQKGRQHVEETLRICRSLLSDGDSMVQKAVGWALREASKEDEGAVYEFLQREKARAHPRILREGSEKLSASHRRSLLPKAPSKPH